MIFEIVSYAFPEIPMKARSMKEDQSRFLAMLIPVVELAPAVYVIR